MRRFNEELSIIQKTYDLIVWFVPILNRLPRDHKYNLGDRIISRLYEILEDLVMAQYSKDKRRRLEVVNGKLEVVRFQVRLLTEFKLIDGERFQYSSMRINEIGQELGGWLKQQKTV
ncbi:hypothetical protein BH20ACI4_BH20ACI4_28430 [soil metagenome]